MNYDDAYLFYLEELEKKYAVSLNKKLLGKRPDFEIGSLVRSKQTDKLYHIKKHIGEVYSECTAIPIEVLAPNTEITYYIDRKDLEEVNYG